MIKHLKYPFARKQVRSLSVGDRVIISGRIFTGRDRLHQHLVKACLPVALPPSRSPLRRAQEGRRREGGKVKMCLKAGAIYHCGPVVIRERGKWIVRAAGPTTSIREEPFMPEIIRRCGVSVIIGKGGMGAGTRAACRKYGCVYLHAVGGAAQVLADKIERVAGVRFLDKFGSAEAMWELIVKDFPAIVTIDAHGRSLHERVAVRSERNLRKLLSGVLPAKHAK